MNIFAAIILTALLIEYAVEIVSNVLTLRALKFEVPPELSGIYKAEDYHQQYLAKRGLGTCHT